MSRLHRPKCGTGIWPDRDIAAGWRDVGGPCGSLPTAPRTQPGNPRGKPRFLTPEDKVPRETDSPLEGGGFEPSVPRLPRARSLHPRARHDPRRHREARNADSFASTCSPCDLQRAWGAFHMDRAGLELEIGFRRLRASRGVLFAFSGKLRDLSGRSATQ